MKVVIIDDASQARKLLRLMLEAIAPDAQLVGEASNAADGDALVRNVAPDLVFLDIEMPGGTGVQLASRWFQDDLKVRVIFTTAFNEYAVSAFRLSAVDYLLKPIQESQLKESLAKVRRDMQMILQQDILLKQMRNVTEEKEKSIIVPVSGGIELVRLNELLYIEADGSYVRIVRTGDRSFTVAKNLKYFETALSGQERFFRSHRSYLINLDQVRRFATGGRLAVIMSDGRELDVAREKKDFILGRLSSK